ncbi:periplasmic heavy metal sensor [Paraburkholderia sp. DHOC27]|uniref:periplasmic heavy metal sensor n=1 Tax=Paraburkholderia sp. DHOC27 TaxID=2303330 RepID=UPI000E3C32A3|nr:periplasmic heavy metal sensor [Paraburkholderia sp. DHOC27]RFU48486.1 periplasmic heavy metal sensor [Paraburkholderia sp. DHOC27]
MNGRSWKILVIASLVLNVFLLGGIAGGAYQWFAGHSGTAKGPAQRTALRFAAEDLSADRQRQFVEALKAARRVGRDYAQAGREGRREVLDVLSAPQLDRAALDAALQRTRAADSDLRAQVESGVADFAATLTPDERIKFVDGLKRAGQWREAPLTPAQKRKAASQ